jgi:hypothetical protein
MYTNAIDDREDAKEKDIRRITEIGCCLNSNNKNDRTNDLTKLALSVLILISSRQWH